MKNILLGLGMAACVVGGAIAQRNANPIDPQPTCNMCPGTYIPLSELEAYTRKAVAEHDLVSEVYHVVSGSATLVLGPDIVNRQRRPATLRTVIELNGPGNNGSDIRNGVAHQIKVTPLKSETQSKEYLSKPGDR